VLGIGMGELLVIAVVILIAVGPTRMPTFFKAVGKGIREFRRTTAELRESVGLNELFEDDDLNELRRIPRMQPRQLLERALREPRPRAAAADPAERDAEYPPDGPDRAHAIEHPAHAGRRAEPPPTEGTPPRSGPGTP
jgi:sec-independent protein translocase protein TatB